MIERITIKDVSPLDGLEVLDVHLTRERIAIPLMTPRYLFLEDRRKETRVEFGHRLREASHEAGRFVADQITKRLREMGHLV